MSRTLRFGLTVRVKDGLRSDHQPPSARIAAATAANAIGIRRDRAIAAGGAAVFPVFFVAMCDYYIERSAQRGSSTRMTENPTSSARCESPLAGPVREQPQWVLGPKSPVTGDLAEARRAKAGPARGHPRVGASHPVTRAAATLLVGLALTTSIVLSARTTPQDQQRPVVRSGTELVQVDVVVLDENGRPVRGLTARDFTVLDRKRPQRIDAFSEINHDWNESAGLPKPPAEVRADVADNSTARSERIVISPHPRFGSLEGSRRSGEGPGAPDRQRSLGRRRRWPCCFRAGAAAQRSPRIVRRC